MTSEDPAASVSTSANALGSGKMDSARPSDTGTIAGISEEETKNIALAQVPGAVASHIRIKTDYDDGRLIYEGEIIFQETEYEFEIDVSIGIILDWDIESVCD